MAEGTILAYETYKECRVPILADGKGGKVRWIADVPWENFNIMEKMSMVINGGAKLTEKDLREFVNTYSDLDMYVGRWPVIVEEVVDGN